MPNVGIVSDVSEIATRYETVAAGFTARVSKVTSDQWSAPTPCSDWTVRDLVAHVIGTQRGVLARLDDTETGATDQSGSLPEQWREASHAIAEAVNDPTRAPTVVGGMFGEQSFESLVGRLVCTDLLVHTWDLARATGQDERLDAAAVAGSAQLLASMDDAIRVPGGFAEKIAPSPGADDQTTFLNFCGRAV
jgi:uncharacterized protein (TIGR03086 family)